MIKLTNALFLILALPLFGCAASVVHKSDLKQLPFEENIVVERNYQEVSLCVKEYQFTEDYSCQFCDLSRGFNGSTLEPRNLTIFNELGFAEISLGFENYLWILMELKKIDSNKTTASIYAMKYVEETAEKFREAIKDCGSSS